MRVGLAVILVVAALAAVVWYTRSDPERAQREPAMEAASDKHVRKPVAQPSNERRDASRGRPERERTDRPGNGRSTPR